MAGSLAVQIAEEYAEQKVLTSDARIDPDILRNLWKANALEVLAFALPRINMLNEDLEATRLMSAAEIQAALTT